MAERTNGNWIGGERRAAADGDRFDLRAPGASGQLLGAWPRSRQPELTAAIEAARRASAWSRAGDSRRRGIVARVTDALLADPDPSGLGASALGWTPAELRAHLTPLTLQREAEPEPWTGDGPVLCAPHWSELFGGLGRVLDVLRAGRAACLIAPAPLGPLADRLVGAALDAGVPAGALAVLHDDGVGALRCALELAPFGLWSGLSCSGPGDPPRYDPRAPAPGGGHPGALAASGALMPFGAGVRELDPAPPAPLTFRALRPRIATVGAGEDVERAARGVVEEALGRSVLGGQLPGQVGLVACHPRVFSRFTAAVLEVLEGPGEPGGPAEPAEPGGELFLDPEVPRELARLRDLGLDEGAVLIHERRPGSTRPSGSPRGGPGRAGGGPGGPGDSPSGTSGGSLGRLVFTNVEPTMRLAGLTRPAPMLLLMRGEA